jgi:uncharacterized protein YjbI with pentapeptide repeats
MSSVDRYDLLSEGAAPWNAFRAANPDFRPDFPGAFFVWRDFSGYDLRGASFFRSEMDHVSFEGAALMGADFSGSCLAWANFALADLTDAKFDSCDMESANFARAILTKCSLCGSYLANSTFNNSTISRARFDEANLQRASFVGARVTDSSLRGAVLIEADMRNSLLHDCDVFGASAWGIELAEADQRGLRITDDVTVDNLEIAQFIYIILKYQNIRTVIDTLTTKLVLILGRFTTPSLETLHRIREFLKKRGYVPVIFDFEKPMSRNLTETIKTLAHLSKFILADITAARAVPVELEAIVPTLPSVPVQPLILKGDTPYVMIESLKPYPWFLEVLEYSDNDQLESEVLKTAFTRMEQVLHKKNINRNS